MDNFNLPDFLSFWAHFAKGVIKGEIRDEIETYSNSKYLKVYNKRTHIIRNMNLSILVYLAHLESDYNTDITPIMSWLAEKKYVWLYLPETVDRDYLEEFLDWSLPSELEPFSGMTLREYLHNASNYKQFFLQRYSISYTGEEDWPSTMRDIVEFQHVSKDWDGKY